MYLGMQRDGEAMTLLMHADRVSRDSLQSQPNYEPILVVAGLVGMHLGDCLQRVGRVTEAQQNRQSGSEFLQRAVEVCNISVRVYCIHAFYAMMFQLNPENRDALHGLSNVLFKLACAEQNTTSAIEYFTRALDFTRAVESCFHKCRWVIVLTPL